jgi:transposase
VIDYDTKIHDCRDGPGLTITQTARTLGCRRSRRSSSRLNSAVQPMQRLITHAAHGPLSGGLLEIQLLPRQRAVGERLLGILGACQHLVPHPPEHEIDLKAGRFEVHADDTPVKVLSKGKCRTGRLWTYVRDDRPFAGTAAPAAAFFYSPDRGGVHPDAHLAAYSGLMQADAYAGFNRLYAAGRKPGPITAAMCWAHARRKFFDVARLNKAPIAIEAVARIDALFEIERDINGKPPPERQRVRAERSRPLVAELKMWLQAQRAKLSAHSDTAKAIAYSLNNWSGLVRFLDDGRLCMTNNAAERALRCVAVGRHNWTFVGSDEGGRRAAAIYTLVETCKLNGVDPRAWLADVLARLPDHPARRIAELLPWNWKRDRVMEAA